MEHIITEKEKSIFSSNDHLESNDQQRWKTTSNWIFNQKPRLPSVENYRLVFELF